MNQMHISYISELPGDCIVLIIVLKKTPLVLYTTLFCRF